LLRSVKAAETIVLQRIVKKKSRHQRKEAKLQLLQDSSRTKWSEQCTK